MTDLGGLACRTMEQVRRNRTHLHLAHQGVRSLNGMCAWVCLGATQRDFEAHVARRDHQLQGEGPGWPLVGYYYLSAGGLQG